MLTVKSIDDRIIVLLNPKIFRDAHGIWEPSLGSILVNMTEKWNVSVFKVFKIIFDI